MIKKLIPYLIGLQICVWLFHIGIGLEIWKFTAIFNYQSLFIFLLGCATLWVYLRLRNTPIENRSWKIIFEHAILIGIIAWFFYDPWGFEWEIYLVAYLTINIVLLLLIIIFESQYGLLTWGSNWWIPDFLWKIWSLVSLLNTITLPLIFILTHESLAVIWLFFGVSWVFLWKEDLS